nr:hypothetical protein [Tanacetum cinerariifolium]
MSIGALDASAISAPIAVEMVQIEECKEQVFCDHPTMTH